MVTTITVMMMINRAYYCRILSSRSGDYEEYYLLRFDAM
jgi:hypothetical protein